MKHEDIIKSVVLFDGIAFDDLKAIFDCIDAKVKVFQKDEVVLLAGDTPTFVGITLSGKFHIVRENSEGVSTFIEAVRPGEIFAAILCGAGILESPVTVFARTCSTVMLLDFSRILHSCPNNCPFHTTLIKNMFRIVATKALGFQARLEAVNIKSLRSKIIHFLTPFALPGSGDIIIPFNREEMANFLCVDRSALSHELSRMKNDGMIEYKKNHFKLFSKALDS